MNLKEDTLYVLKENGKTPEDIEWIGTRELIIPQDKFWQLADVEFDDGYGSAEVAIDLIIVGKGWWMSRGEYDGSEWWDFNWHPKKPKIVNTNIKFLVGDGGWRNTIMDINGEENK